MEWGPTLMSSSWPAPTELVCWTRPCSDLGGLTDTLPTIDLSTLIERKEILEMHLETVVLEPDKTKYSL